MIIGRATEETIEKLAAALREAFAPNHADIKTALERLCNFKPQDVPVQFKAASGHSVYGKTTRKDVIAELKQDSEQPFFCEAYLYNLLGKEDARSLLGRFRALCAALGVEMEDLYPAEEPHAEGCPQRNPRSPVACNCGAGA